MIECDDCRRQWEEQVINSNAWHCPACKHKIGD